LKKVIMVILIFSLLSGMLSACDSDSNSALSFLSGNKSQNEAQNTHENLPKIRNDAKEVKQNKVLEIAKKYYEEIKDQVEDDLADEFDRVVDWTPVFDGTNQDTELNSKLSMDVAIMVTYYDAKNFFLALASAVFEKDVNSVVSATNLATAISAYCDRSIMDGDESRKKEMYNDAISVYLYAVKLSAEDGKYTQSSIIPLICLGNLYLDYKKNKEAFDCYDMALKIDPNNKNALMGMESYYRAVNNKAKMLAMQERQAKTVTVMGNAANKIEKDRESIKEGADLTGEALEEFTIKMSELPPVTLADFYESVDPDTAKKIRENVKSAQNKMDFAVPSADVLLQYSHYSHTAEPAFLGAMTAFLQYDSQNMQKKYKSGEMAEDITDSMENYTEMLDGMGIDLEIDGMNLSDFVKKRMKNPNDESEPEVNLSGLGDAVKNAKDMLKAMENNDRKTHLEDMAKTDKSYRIMTVNPFEYANSYDILVQQNNIASLKSKAAIHKSNIAGIMGAMINTLSETTMKLNEKYYPIGIEYAQKVKVIEEKYTDEELIVKLHELHAEYYPRINAIIEPLWAQATNVVAVNYKKLEKYLPVMYKDCMKYIMLISDDDIREKEEGDLKRFLEETVFAARGYVSTAYGLPTKLDIKMCDCDTEQVNALKEQFKQQAKKAENERLKKLRQDRNDFLSGKLDENTQLYQKIIKKYEYTTDFGIYKYTHNEYKSTTEVSIWTPNASLDYQKMQNHFTGKTYVNADMELSGKLTVIAAEADVTAKFGFSYVKGKDGSIHPDDIDIRSGLSASMSAGKAINISAGAEASALRGLTGNASISLTGNGYIDDFKKANIHEAVTDWIKTPDFSKPVWKGKYTIEQ